MLLKSIKEQECTEREKVMAKTKSIEKMSYSDLLAYVQKNMDEINRLKAECKNLTCQLEREKKKCEEQWYENKLQMMDIVKYRRLIEHYEDGAPNYVRTANM